MVIDLHNQVMLKSIEAELHNSIGDAAEPELKEYYHILAYHLGWEGENAGPVTQGKRIRPQLVLLTCSAAGGDWQNALPAAVAVELVHNFSLIHDDIQDNSPIRRGRETVWKRWGIPQAINAGDAMFTLAHLSILRMDGNNPPEIANDAAKTLQMACLELTKGQYLDLKYESKSNLPIEAYWQMVGGKTAALLGACTELGAITARTSQERRENFRDFGYFLGLAFQAQDDLLGIWGDAALTGKSNESDLITGKKSLPILYGLVQNGPFAERWAKGDIQTEEIAALADQLDLEGARVYTQEAANEMTEKSLNSLDQARPHGTPGKLLKDLAVKLLNRKG
jgi:geranylgeranyl diphosphate synthase type I